MKIADLSSTLLLSLALLACGRSNTIYPDQHPQTLGTDDQVAISDAVLPSGFYDQSVNQASTKIRLDDRTSRSQSFALATEEKTNADGKFNSSGVGNLAVLGLSQLEGTRLSDLPQITIFQKVVSGTEPLRILLSVDLKCDGTQLRLFSSTGETTNDLDAPSGYTALSADLDSKTWDLGDGTLVDLHAQLTESPDACLKSSLTGAAIVSRETATAGIALALGGPSVVTENVVVISQIKLDSQILEAGDRSQ